MTSPLVSVSVAVAVAASPGKEISWERVACSDTLNNNNSNPFYMSFSFHEVNSDHTIITSHPPVTTCNAAQEYSCGNSGCLCAIRVTTSAPKCVGTAYCDVDSQDSCQITADCIARYGDANFECASDTDFCFQATRRSVSSPSLALPIHPNVVL